MFCSKIVGPGPTTFYLPSSQAKFTEFNNEREKFACAQSLGKTHFSSATKFLEKSCYRFFCECALNVMNGTVGINLQELRPYGKQLRLLCGKLTSIKESREIFDVIKRSEIDDFDKSSWFLLFDRLIPNMKTHEVLLQVI